MNFSELDFADKVFYIAIVIIALIVIGGSIFCLGSDMLSFPSTNQSIPEDLESNQFALIGDEGTEGSYFRALFFVDQKTGVEYVMLAGELTPRYDSNGSLIIHSEYVTEGEA